MADHDIRILRSLAAMVARSADRYEAAANAADDARLVTPLNDRASERRRAAAALLATAHERGGAPDEPPGLGGSIASGVDGVRAALSGSDDHARLRALASFEEDLDAAFSQALDGEPSPAVAGEIDAIRGSLAAAREQLAAVLATHPAPR